MGRFGVTNSMLVYKEHQTITHIYDMRAQDIMGRLVGVTHYTPQFELEDFASFDCVDRLVSLRYPDVARNALVRAIFVPIFGKPAAV